MGVLFARETENDSFTPVGMMGVGNASQSQRGLMTAQDKVKLDGIADYIVEQGTDGIWTYRKWNSGIVELFGKDTASRAVSSGSAPIYWGDSPYYDFPFTVLTVATATANFIVPSGLVWGSLSVVGTTNARCRLFTSSAGTYSVTALLTIVGTWK